MKTYTKAHRAQQRARNAQARATLDSLPIAAPAFTGVATGGVTELIDCTPTWEEIARMLVHTLQCNPQNEMAREELLRMGKIIDQQQARIEKIRGAL